MFMDVENNGERLLVVNTGQIAWIDAGKSGGVVHFSGGQQLQVSAAQCEKLLLRLPRDDEMEPSSSRGSGAAAGASH